MLTFIPSNMMSLLTGQQIFYYCILTDAQLFNKIRGNDFYVAVPVIDWPCDNF